MKRRNKVKDQIEVDTLCPELIALIARASTSTESGKFYQNYLSHSCDGCNKKPNRPPVIEKHGNRKDYIGEYIRQGVNNYE